MNFQNIIQEIYCVFKYDIFKASIEVPENMDEKILNQRVRIQKSEEGYFIESLDYPNLYASGDDLDELREAYYDTILTYFDIPRYFAKRRIDNLKLDLADGTEIKAKSYASNSRFVGA